MKHKKNAWRLVRGYAVTPVRCVCVSLSLLCMREREKEIERASERARARGIAEVLG